MHFFEVCGAAERFI